MTHPDAPPVHLIVRLELPDKPVKEFSYDFRQSVISMGRDPNNDIQIPLTTVSRNHARIFFEMSDYFLEDLGSTHGSKINGKKLGKREKKLLRDGDLIEIMSFSLTFKTSPARMLDRQPGEKTEQLARRMVQEVLASLDGSDMDPTSLRVMNGIDEGRRYEISEEQAEVVLGRSPECDVVLDDQNTSRRHCLIKRTWNGFTAQDLGSKNGVLVNGTRIEGVQALKDGDEVQIGGVKLTFIDPASRILDQFGVGEETVQPGPDLMDAETPGAEEAEGEEEAYSDEQEAYDEEDDVLSSGDFAAQDDEGLAEEGEEDEEDSIDDLEAGLDSDVDIPPGSQRGIGAEVVILIVGLGIFFGAVSLAIILYM